MEASAEWEDSRDRGRTQVRYSQAHEAGGCGQPRLREGVVLPAAMGGLLPAGSGSGSPVFPAASSLCSCSVKGLHETATGSGSPLKRDPRWEGALNASTPGPVWRRSVWTGHCTGQGAKGRGLACCRAQTRGAAPQKLGPSPWGPTEQRVSRHVCTQPASCTLDRRSRGHRVDGSAQQAVTSPPYPSGPLPSAPEPSAI